MTPERWAQIESLYHEAQGRPPAERAAFLREACPADDSLRREVEDLLKQSGSDDGFLARRRPAVADAIREAARQSVLSGRSLGGYALKGLIGVGGMGEVYRARDAKLGRHVAIKVLPAAFTADPGRLTRFEREARALAALNHPNVCAIYGFEESEGIRFLILELVEGETLADKLGRLAAKRRTAGGLSQREALNIARQIARALDVAHERGIVHRDLKPANIKITNGDVVKVLDFGLAKAVTGDGPDIPVGVAETATMGGTLDGAIVGTPAYMSPEQARGHAVDKRTDIWAFGCVLYEMLTGRAAFGGDTLSDTIASVLEREPDWSRLPTDTPEPIRNLLVGCLAKDPRDRLRDIGDVRISIDSTLSGSSGATRAAVPAHPPGRRAVWLPWILVMGLAAGLAAMAAWSLRPPPAPKPYPSTFNLPAGQQFDRSGGAHLVTISRDGKQIAFVVSPGLLYLRPTDEQEGKPISGLQTEKGIREPAFSPRADEIAFYSFAAKGLMRVSVTGGNPVLICDSETPSGIDWAKDDLILYGQKYEGLFKVNPNGGGAQLVRKFEGYEVSSPHLLPDKDHVLLTLATGSRRDRWDRAQIVVYSQKKDQYWPLAITGGDARYVPSTGHLVYAVRGQLRAAKFDPHSPRAVGKASPVGVEDVSRSGGAYTAAAHFSIADTGTLVYIPGLQPGPMVIAVFRADGTFEREVLLTPDRYDHVRVSPDGQRVAYTRETDTPTTVYVHGVVGTRESTPLRCADKAPSRFPAWVFDGAEIAFQCEHAGSRAIWMQDANGTRPPYQVTYPPGGETHTPESWSSKTKTLLYSVTTGTDDLSVTLKTIPWRDRKPGEPQPFGNQSSSDPMSATLSPGEDWVAYTRTDSDGTTICVEPFPLGGAQCLPRRGADSAKHPRWIQTPKGLRLYFDPRIGDFESVAVYTQPFKWGDFADEPHEFLLAPPGARTPYDISREGRIVGLTTPVTHKYTATVENRMAIHLHWLEILKEKVPR